MEIPFASAKNLLKKAGVRVGNDAVLEFSKLLEDIIADVAAEAVANAKRRGVKTVDIEDVMAARRKIL